MQCPSCGSLKSSVLDSRYKQSLNHKRRRRQCNSCGETYTTFERIASSQLKMPRVVKRDGRREAFDFDKVKKGLLLAVAKRSIPTEAMDSLIETVAERLAKSGEKEVSTERVGMVVMGELRKLDHVAYIRFASVYRNFKDAGAFRDEVHEVGGAVSSRASDAQGVLFQDLLDDEDG